MQIWISLFRQLKFETLTFVHLSCGWPPQSGKFLEDGGGADAARCWWKDQIQSRLRSGSLKRSQEFDDVFLVKAFHDKRWLTMGMLEEKALRNKWLRRMGTVFRLWSQSKWIDSNSMNEIGCRTFWKTRETAKRPISISFIYKPCDFLGTIPGPKSKICHKFLHIKKCEIKIFNKETIKNVLRESRFH